MYIFYSSVYLLCELGADILPLLMRDLFVKMYDIISDIFGIISDNCDIQYNNLHIERGTRHYCYSTKASALLKHLSLKINPKCEFNSSQIKILDSCSINFSFDMLKVHMKLILLHQT